jgi:hypothetical protein
MIRPEFFTDADLVDLPPLTRLLFIGLWTLADREGRLKDRPKTIKLAVFPADDVDVDAALDALNEVGSIRRYEIDGEHYVDIPGFITHQRIHPGEAASTIPPFKHHRITKKVPISREAVKRSTPAVKLHGQQLSVDVDVDVKEEPAEKVVLFDTYWDSYPNKNGKDSARKTWLRLPPADKQRAVEIARLMTKVVAAGKREKQFCPGGAVFLNQRRWEDWADGPPAGYELNGNGNGSREEDW